MMMDMLFSREWLREQIASDPDFDTDAGTPAGVLRSVGMFFPPDLGETSYDGNVARLKHAFGVLVRQLRKRDRLSLEDLAKRARVDLEDLRQIEQDPHFRPRPRVVHQLAQVFRVPERALLRLSGATSERDEQFVEEAYRFAAKSDDLSKLSRDEQRLLNEFVRFLSQQNS
jgi:transcriptional regulator with XRE-family HTH domain